jgi:molybdenum cofactor cytidylyltransferase
VSSATAEPGGGVIGAVLLGAGFSTRFGSDKRLHDFNGITVAEATLTAYAEVFTDIRVVVRATDEALQEKLAAFDTQTIIAPDAHLGMGHSLAAGCENLAWTWAFVGLLDMPFVLPETLLKLRDTARATQLPGIVCPIVAGRDRSRFGHPVGWHSDYFDELSASSGDEGARSILARHKDRIISVIVEDEGIYRDIDVPADLA